MTEKVRPSGKKNIILIFIILAIVLLAGLGYFLLTGTKDEVKEDQDTLVTETTDEETEPEVGSDNALVGSYSGTYKARGADEAFPASFTVSEDMTIRGSGRLADGSPFTVMGEVRDDGSFGAEGTVEGTGREVSFTGSFTETADTVIANGEWQSGTLRGTWELEKN